jgi:hypothetical protein
MSASSALLDEEVRCKGTIELLKAVEDQHGGVIINIDEPMDSYDFASMLQDSLSQWRTQVDFKPIIIKIAVAVMLQSLKLKKFGIK